MKRYFLFFPNTHAMTRQKTLKNRNSRNGVVSITPDAQSLREQERLRQAVLLHQQGFLDEAEAIYREICSSVPDNFDALRLLAAISAQKGDFQRSVELFEQACSINPVHPETLYNYGIVLHELSRFDEALQRYDMAVALKPEQGNACFRKALLLHEMNRYEEALSCFDRVIALMPAYCEAYHRKGNTLLSLKRYEEAMRCYNNAISCNPRYAVAYNRRGNVQHELGRYEEALASYEKAFTLDPGYAEACNNHGVVLKALNRTEEALSSYEKALEIKPDYAKAHYNRGNVLQSMYRNEDALSSYDRAIALKPDYTEAFFARASVLQALGRYDEALQSYEKVEEYTSGSVQMYVNRGVLFTELKRYPDAIADFGKALAIKPDSDFLFGQFLHAKMHLCDWQDFTHNISEFERKIRIGSKVSPPFPVLALLDSPALQLGVVRIFVAANSLVRQELPPIVRPGRTGRIRLGYFSADFHNHATAYLMAELFERHDRSRFELFAFSFGPDVEDGMRKRVAASFDRFIDVRTLSDRRVAELSRELGIDIAVDLKGFTRGGRRNIFAYRAAPVQVSYLGYPGTMGADYIDYLIADKHLIPERSRQYYTEKIVYLPDSYQVNDSHRKISERVFMREECCLPEHGFVFACFNKHYKITPEFFGGWMRILKQVEGSVLWLFDGYTDAVDNLRRAAAEHGVAGERLVFAKRMPLAEHLSRHRLADLFLDTLPCNAHTTASDALWAGLPVLTRIGEAFAGRVAASLLMAIGLPELITTTQEEYEALAVTLALDSEMLRGIREKLARNLTTAPLFDTERFTGYLEAAYDAMYEQYHAELPPDHLVIAEGAGRSDAAFWLPTALALRRQGQLDEAAAIYQDILRIQPENRRVLNLSIEVALQQKRFVDVVSLADRLMQLDPSEAAGYAQKAAGYAQKAGALTELKRYKEAVSLFDQAIMLQPEVAEMYNNRGVALAALCRYEDAVESYHEALRIRKDYAVAHANLGGSLVQLKRYSGAVSHYEDALNLKPDYDFLFGEYLHLKMKICDWHDLGPRLEAFPEKINGGGHVSTPFPLLALLDLPEIQKKAAGVFVTANYPENHGLAEIPKRVRHDRIHIGYYSGDFHNHATAYLMAELFDRHDRSRFELTAFSFGPDLQDAMRMRVAASFDRFLDVRNRTEREVAELSRELEIDIAVDLKGFTKDSRTGIFAFRAAPVQVSYLGYPGTMGAGYIDYLIADKVLIPEGSRQYYTEKIVWMPDSYQVNDAYRKISERVFTREECGLPEHGFVFACFNNNYKITPEIFDGWMRILKQVEGSVLWLFEDNALVAENLRREAVARGVTGERLVFAKRMLLAEHLSRHRLADLFLDTLPCNAHTTASDALWAGLPVLTCMGEAFAGRVAASLLTAVGLPELVTSTQEEYESLALELALESERLRSIREKLERNRKSAPLFDTERFTGYLEAAYDAMYERYHAELPPDHLVIAEVARRSDAAVRLPSALALHRQGHIDEAAAIYREILSVSPENSDVLQLLAGVAVQKNEMTEAVVFFDKAIALTPDRPELYNNRANVFLTLGRYDEALANYRQALALKPEDVDVWSNCGNVLKLLGRKEEALLMFDKALHLKSDDRGALFNKGMLLNALQRNKEALSVFDELLVHNPGHVRAICNRGNVLACLKRYEDAVRAYQQVLFLKADYAFLFSRYLHTRMKICDWGEYDQNLVLLKEKIERGEKIAGPFPVLALLDAPYVQQKAAAIYVKERYPENRMLPEIPKRSRRDKIRIGYFSADFHNHATAYLMAELFERHDRSRFEIIAFSFGPDSKGTMRKRLALSFDRFLDVRAKSDREIAELSRELGIDIAVDLKGYTTDSRTGIFAYRAAPVQVSYLGYPGTMGAEYIDYLIADQILVPESSQEYYMEKIVYLPDSYQVNDTSRHIAERVFTRDECGLPEKGFVFCCFNNNYKITPDLFNSWMQILKKVDGSVLWLLEDNRTAAENLLREASVRGIGAERLVFAKRMPLAEHLSRHSLADLFLDTLPCNAHTTASDALWAGLPLLTLTGESFASRVAASLLNAIHLSELITSTQEEYEALAIELATNPEKLGKIRQKLAQNRFTTPLFDTKRFTRNLEQVYCMMYERSQQELPPAHLFSLPSAQGGTGTIQPLQQEYACCPLCGGKSALRCRADCSRHSLWHEPLPRILEWMRCTNCHHVYTRQFWTQAGIDELFRNAHQNQLAGFGASQDAKRANWVPVVDKVLNLLGGYRSIMDNGSHPTWVDVGCGDGALAMTASDYGFSALGLDARSEAVRRIIELGFKAQEGDFMQCTFEHKLDVLSMMDVLEHMPYPGLALGKAAELVRPGGVLVISLPDLSCSSWRMMDAAKSNPYWMEIEHHHNFSRERLIALLGERGFGVADFGIPHRYKAQMELYAVRKNLFM
jgi:predicted O-linked N-acetylglucosamine transferase (SPINDLY family)/SAM-dependent methyltransferase